MTSLTLRIDGMSCTHCLSAVNKALAGVAGVSVEQVRIGAATVRYDPAKTTGPAIIAAIRTAGYEAGAAET